MPHGALKGSRAFRSSRRPTSAGHMNALRALRLEQQEKMKKGEALNRESASGYKASTSIWANLQRPSLRAYQGTRSRTNSSGYVNPAFIRSQKALGRGNSGKSHLINTRFGTRRNPNPNPQNAAMFKK